MSLKNPLLLTSLVACFALALSAPAHAQPGKIELYLRVNGANSVDLSNVILVPSAGNYVGEVIVRETVGTGTALLGASPGLASVNFTIMPFGGAIVSNESSGFTFDTSEPGIIRGGLIGTKPQTEVPSAGSGVFEAVAGTFDIVFDGISASFLLNESNSTADDFGVFPTAGGNAVLDPYFTNFNVPIMLTTAVPEPSSLAMVGIAALAMIRRRRR